VSFLPMEAIGEDGSLELDRVRPLADVQTGYTFFRDGDVTIAKITPCFENGKGAAMRDLCNGIGFGTTELIVARPKATQTTSTYLHWLFTSRPFRKAGEAFMYGAGGQKRVPDDFVRDFAIGFPPLPEQRHIVTFLDREGAKIDALVEEQRRLIELLKEKRQAVISQAVTKGLNPNVPMKDSGVEWLGRVPAHWLVLPLKYVVTFKSGGTPDKNRPDFWDGDVPWASAKDLKVDLLPDTADHISEIALAEGAATLVSAGTVLVVVRGMILARTFPVVTTAVDMAINQDLKAVTARAPSRNDWLAWLLRASTVETLSRLDEAGHGTKALRMDTWGDMRVAVPPRDEQERIASFLRSECRSYRWPCV
jgi:type I restriction enzyme S subunit